MGGDGGRGRLVGDGAGLDHRAQRREPGGQGAAARAECLFGGGFIVWQGATLTILNSEIEENVARYGGGIKVTLASTLVVRESKLTRNRYSGTAAPSGSATSGSWSR